MKNEKLFIHVGLPKTGTTFLQHEIFPKIKNVNFIHYQNFAMEIYTDKLNIISNEELFGYKVRGSNAHDRFTIADRLKLCFPDAKIILGLRNKKTWLKSCYKQWVRDGGIHEYDYWFNNIFDVSFLNFDEYINYLKSIFDNVYIYTFENLKNNTDECLKNICNFIGCDVPIFENKKYNVGWNDKQIKIARFLNRCFKSNTVHRIIWLSGSGRWLR